MQQILKFKKIRKRYLLNKVLIGIFVLTFIFFAFTIFTVLRYRQLCSYENASSQKLISTEISIDFCPNILDTKNLPQILANAFNFGLTSSFKVNAQSISETTIQSQNEQCNSDTDIVCWVKQMGGELKQTDGFTNLLLAVSDNRGHSGNLWGNTDSIMVMSLNNLTGKMLFISFPRDLLVEYNSPNGRVSSKINSIYALYGREIFSSAVEEIIGKPIHYSAIINFDVFSNLIDQLGGVDIYLDKPFQDLYPCSEVPYGYSCNGEFGWFTFPQGLNHFNSFQATVYARSRYASSDYSRAKRQQDLVKAVIKNALEKDLPLTSRFTLYQNMFNSFTSKVESNIEIKDMAGVLSVFDKLSDDAASIVLDPSVNNRKLIYEYGITEFGWVTKFYDYSYSEVNQYIKSIWDNLTFYIEKPKILVLNASGKDILNDSNIYNFINNSNFAEIKQENSSSNFKGIRVYDLSGGNRSGTIKEISKAIPEALLYSSEIDRIKKSSFSEDVLIIIGK